MRKLLNTLYVTTPDAYLRLDGENVVLIAGDDVLGRLPLHNINSVVCFSFMGVSPALMNACAEKGISLCFLSPSGRFLARMVGPVHGNVLLREAQMILASNPTRAVEAASYFLSAKIYNSRWVLERSLRDHRIRMDEMTMNAAISQQKVCLNMLEGANDIGTLMGVEGVAAKAYFSVFDQMILRNEDCFHFENRSRRPPTDRINALLSLTYTLLTNEICGALESVGLDPYVGYLHQKRPGRCSLALDVLEELRAPIADRFVLSQVNLGTIVPEDFDIKENGAVYLTDDARRRYLAAWQKKKQETITHPFLKEKIPWGLVPYVQSVLFARWLRGDIDAYPPFFWK
ncbi:MAG: type I-C CRISPR-associated endonuclease Cas1 [Clostridiales bacterium]|nr:type I-C CRISPR-associated endonuclease Cas1 [Clostridiales bacterium]